MRQRNNQDKQGGSHERPSPSPQHSPASNDACGPTHPSSLQPPPPYATPPHSAGSQATHVCPHQRESSPPRSRRLGISLILVIILAQAAAFIIFYNHQKRLLEGERHLLEQEKEALRQERGKWEKAREDRVPQGAFWEDILPVQDCRAYGKREYWGILQNIPEGWNDLDACMNMPVEIKGVSVRRPHRCKSVAGSIHGFWMVDWDQPDCKPWHEDFIDKGCSNPGSGIRRVEARIMGINDRPEQDWRLLCDSTPMTWNHVTYNIPNHCWEHWFGWKYAMWDIPDSGC